MSKTKTGIIGLVVLIVILIGVYSFLTHSGENGLVVDNTASSTENMSTGTDMVIGTSTTETTEGEKDNSSDMEHDGGAVAGNSDATSNPSANGNTDDNATGDGGNGDQFGVGGDQGGVEVSTSDTGSYEASSVGYMNEDEDIAFKYPATWNINEDEHPDSGDLSVTMGQDFAGGMKAEMNITVYEDATIVSDDSDNSGNDDTFTVAGSDKWNITEGTKYKVELDCKGEDLDCAGGSYIIPVSGHMESDGWHGKVVKVNYGVFQMPDYEGPDSGVSAQELFNVAQSVFQGVSHSVHIGGVSGGPSLT